MNTQPIDPRALKAAEALYPNGEPNTVYCWAEPGKNERLIKEFQESKARIIQSHFAESVNWKLLEAAKSLEQFCVSNPSLVRDIDDFVWIPFTEAVKRAQSQPPSMADELAEALRKACTAHVFDGSYRRPGLEILARYAALKGQS